MLLKMENVNLVYDSEKEVPTYSVVDINLSLDGNKFIGVMGPSGSGKSSLLYIMAGLKKPTIGRVCYKNIDYSTLTPAQNAELRRRNFGFIFQRHFLIDYMTVMDNVLTPINDDSKRAKLKATSILSRLGIEKISHKKPFEISGGQRQKVAIARALITDPEIIFADEPTAALDDKSAHEVVEFLKGYENKKMLIMVNHDIDILSSADYLINMRDGKISSIIERKGEEDEAAL